MSRVFIAAVATLFVLACASSLAVAGTSSYDSASIGNGVITYVATASAGALPRPCYRSVYGRFYFVANQGASTVDLYGGCTDDTCSSGCSKYQTFTVGTAARSYIESSSHPYNFTGNFYTITSGLQVTMSTYYITSNCSSLANSPYDVEIFASGASTCLPRPGEGNSDIYRCNGGSPRRESYTGTSCSGTASATQYPSNVCSGAFGTKLWTCSSSGSNLVVSFYRASAASVATFVALGAIVTFAASM